VTDDRANGSFVHERTTLGGILPYAAPVAGTYLFYSAMWSILPGVYSKYFGLSLTSIGAAILIMRLFDGVIDMTVGYFSDWHRSNGGSRKSWTFIGGIGTIVSCYFLFTPPNPATVTYYLLWSLLFFLAFTIGEIPHLTWGSELTSDYQARARVYAIRMIMSRVGTLSFYALPLLPVYVSSEYTPQVMHDAVFVGAVLGVAGLGWMILRAPAGDFIKTPHKDNPRLLLQSLIHNKPLLLYFAAYGCVGVSAGMWFGLLYIYFDAYLGVGGKMALMLLLGAMFATASTPLWLNLIRRTSKSTVWAIGVLLFFAQLIGTLFVKPHAEWWIPFTLIAAANLFFTCHDVAALSILGDIVDYGKWRFGKDRGATYFACNTLLFKIGLGVGGALSLGVAGLFGFAPGGGIQSQASILGLKLGFAVLPAAFSIIGAVLILRTPIDRRRHHIIQRRIEGRQRRLQGIAKAFAEAGITHAAHNIYKASSYRPDHCLQSPQRGSQPR
jgi:glycoside/pentoside/hexuronide:cation symporter, GPH family